MREIDEERIVDQIYEARDSGRSEVALDLALEAIDSLGEDPVLRFLAGICLLDLDEVPRAVEELRRAAALDPDDAEFRANLAYALFKACRFAEAEGEAKRALDIDPKMPEAHQALALVLERRGRIGEADEHLLRASRLDPEAFPLPTRLATEAFEKEVLRAEEKLPEEFRRRLAEVAVTVEPFPSDQILLAEDPALDPELLGLFVGVSLTDKAFQSSCGDLPPRILLFQRNLERYCAGEDFLCEEIAVTLYHELGHYLGLDEDELADIDLA